jgi:hypothetical protein
LRDLALKKVRGSFVAESKYLTRDYEEVSDIGERIKQLVEEKRKESQRDLTMQHFSHTEAFANTSKGKQLLDEICECSQCHKVVKNQNYCAKCSKLYCDACLFRTKFTKNKKCEGCGLKGDFI